MTRILRKRLLQREEVLSGEELERAIAERVAEAKKKFETEMTVDELGIVRDNTGKVIDCCTIGWLEQAGCDFDRNATRQAQLEQEANRRSGFAFL